MCDYCEGVKPTPDYERLKAKVQKFVDSLAGQKKVYVRSVVDAWNQIVACEEYMDDEIREALRELAEA